MFEIINVIIKKPVSGNTLSEALQNGVDNIKEK